MIRKIRQALSIVFLLCVTLLFLDFTGTAHAWLGWMAEECLPLIEEFMNSIK